MEHIEATVELEPLDADPRTNLLAWLTSHNASLSAQFVPWSQSRNKAEKTPSLNWRVKLSRGDREVYTFDYGAGSGHCPTYKGHGYRYAKTVDGAAAIKAECETGRACVGRFNLRGPQITPDPADILASLACDIGEFIAGTTFENWASNFGYDTDSRKAEAIYNACLQTYLALKAAFGESGCVALVEAAEGY